MSSSTSQLHVIIACGGTGGHLFPGIAVGETLLARGHQVTLLISEKKIDSLAASGHADLHFEKMPFQAMPKPWSPKMVPFLLGLWKGLKQCRALIKKTEADVVLGMGGFTSLIPLVAGKQEKCKTLIHESNAIPGKSNKLNARFCNIVLCGLESCEPLPPLSQLNATEVDTSLAGLKTSLSTAMQFSFFITKDMRRDLANTRFKGVLPVILTFMARTGHSVDSVDLVRLDGNGQPVIANAGGNAPGLLIRGYSPSGHMKRVFYFRQDLSDGGLHPGGAFLKFVSSLGRPPAFVKSASYLMHEDGFQTIRNYLLTSCRGIVQDPSGVPYRNLLAAGADVRLYGNYQGTLDMFKAHQQPDLIAAYQQGGGVPLSFGVGYLYRASNTCLMVGRPGVRVSVR